MCDFFYFGLCPNKKVKKISKGKKLLTYYCIIVKSCKLRDSMIHRVLAFLLQIITEIKAFYKLNFRVGKIAI